MASYQAVTTVCQGVINLLRSRSFDTGLEFDVYSVRNFNQPMGAGVSLFLYRILPNVTFRTPPGREVDGHKQRVQLPVDLYFLLTAWGEDASRQNLIAGWMMRVLADYPILPVGILNATTPNVFRSNEIIEISIAEMNTEDLFHVWEGVSANNYQISVPYLARNVRLESEETDTLGPSVQTREFTFTDDLTAESSAQ